MIHQDRQTAAQRARADRDDRGGRGDRTDRTDRGDHSDGEMLAALASASKSFGAISAVSKLDFAVRAGEVVALLGPNGAGKTTTVRLLMGLVRPSSGTARVFGMDPSRLAARLRMGAMLQVAKVPETLRVREHIELFSSYYPRPLPLGELLDIAGLQGLAERPFGKLSGGQRQRVLFALALCGDPDLLFLDEPSAGLDVETRRSLWEQIAARRRSGASVLLTTHNLEEADRLADRIVLLDHGRLLAEGTPAQIKARVSGRTVRCRTVLDTAALERLPGVRTVRREGDDVEIFAAEAERLVAALLAADPALTGLEVRGAGLEEAFLALTGGQAPGAGEPGLGTPPRSVDARNTNQKGAAA
jgi:ABC-2 type transport system ATP-binding protein